MSSQSSRKKETAPTGVLEIDHLATLELCTIQDYIIGVSAYVRRQSTLAKGPKKAAQIRLSNALARSLATDIEGQLPQLCGRLATHEQKVAGGLRTVKADVSESHSLDGLRFAVELKPINLAVGRAIWNRFGDIRTFAVNIHLKFPFAVVGGVLVIPTYEETGTRDARLAAEIEKATAEGEEAILPVEDGQIDNDREQGSADHGNGSSVKRKETLNLVSRAVERLLRAGGRRSEADAAHLLEGIAVVVYDPDTAQILPDVPRSGTRLRWDEFIEDLATSYRARFED